MKEEIIKKFWNKVYTCNPKDIKTEEIKLVSDDDIDFLLKEILQIVIEDVPHKYQERLVELLS